MNVKTSVFRITMKNTINKLSAELALRLVKVKLLIINKSRQHLRYLFIIFHCKLDKAELGPHVDQTGINNVIINP